MVNVMEMFVFVMTVGKGPHVTKRVCTIPICRVMNYQDGIASRVWGIICD